MSRIPLDRLDEYANATSAGPTTSIQLRAQRLGAFVRSVAEHVGERHVIAAQRSGPLLVPFIHRLHGGEGPWGR